jgi:hypothetical protein
MPVIRNEFFSTPLASYAIIAIFHNLEPSVSSGVVACGGVGDFLHVNSAGTFVAGIYRSSSRDGGHIGDGAVFECQVGARVDAGNTGHTGLAIYAYRTISLAFRKEGSDGILSPRRFSGEERGKVTNYLPQAISGVATFGRGKVACPILLLIRTAVPSP